MLKNPTSYSEDNAKSEESLEDIMENLRSKILPKTKSTLKFMLPICREAVSNREKTKSMLVRSINIFRKAYWTLGKLMVAEARLPDAELIFYLKHG